MNALIGHVATIVLYPILAAGAALAHLWSMNFTGSTPMLGASGAIMGLVLEKKAEHAFRNPLLLAGTLAGMGLVLWAADRSGRKTRNMQSLSLLEALVIPLESNGRAPPAESRSAAVIRWTLVRGRLVR